MPEAVQVTGMLHGVLFVTYCVMVIQVKIEQSWSFKKMMLALVASVLPLGPFIADKKLFKEEEQQMTENV